MKKDHVSSDSEETDIAFEIQKSFVDQFGENQNHQQKLFIKFLSSVIVVIAAYALVYINTASFDRHLGKYKEAEEGSMSVSDPIKFSNLLDLRYLMDFDTDKHLSKVSVPTKPALNYEAFLSQIDSLEKADSFYSKDSVPKHSNRAKRIQKNDSLFSMLEHCREVKVHVFNATKTDNGVTVSFAIIHLIIIYLFAQILMGVLGTIILHMGYSYRRDQVVVNKIRSKSLTKPVYLDFFGSGFFGDNKNFFEYQPNFNLTLFYAILLTQASVYLSIYVYFNQFPNGMVVFSNIVFKYGLTFYNLKIILVSPLLFTMFMYWYYNRKYVHQVLGKIPIPLSGKRQLGLKFVTVQILFYIVCIVITMFFAWVSKSFIMLFLALYFGVRFIFNPYFIVNVRSEKHAIGLLRNKGRILIFLSVVIFIFMLNCILRHISIATNFFDTYRSVTFILVLQYILIFYIKMDALHSHFLFILFKQLSKDLIFIFSISSVAVVGYLTQMHLFEYIILLLISARMLFLGRNNFKIAKEGYRVNDNIPWEICEENAGQP